MTSGGTGRVEGRGFTSPMSPLTHEQRGLLDEWARALLGSRDPVWLDHLGMIVRSLQKDDDADGWATLSGCVVDWAQGGGPDIELPPGLIGRTAAALVYGAGWRYPPV